jgi:tetrapyrrole methylase family protein/MazG family protein
MGEFAGVRRIVATLRGPAGCPWDRVQTHETLRPYLLEEAAESLEAIASEDPARMTEELGDLLFQILIHVQLAEEAGAFTMKDVLRGLSEKLVNRHPHVFGDAVAKTPDAVVEQWDDLKRQERSGRSALAGIPGALPALAKSQALQRRAVNVGFAWENAGQAWDKLDEEIAELRGASTPHEREAELGDVLFALGGLAGWLKIDAEDALRSTCGRFRERFERVEDLAVERGIDLSTEDLAAKLALWDEAKSLSR